MKNSLQAKWNWNQGEISQFACQSIVVTVVLKTQLGIDLPSVGLRRPAEDTGYLYIDLFN